MAANGNPAAPERPGKAMRAVRLAFLVLAVAGALWLFLVYQPPRKADRPGREKVVFWHMWTSHWAEVVERIVERFNDSQDRWQVVPLTVIGGSLKTLIATAGGDPPDCMAQWEPVIPAWAEREALVPLETLMSPTEWETLRDKMYPAVRAIGTYQGHFSGLSTGMNIWALYYRPDHFRAAGLDPDRFPETLEALWDTAAKLYQTDAGGHITRIGFFPQMYPHYVALFGGTFYDEATGGPVFLDPKNVEALAWMRRWASEYDFEKVQGFQQSLTATFGASAFCKKNR